MKEGHIVSGRLCPLKEEPGSLLLAFILDKYASLSPSTCRKNDSNVFKGWERESNNNHILKSVRAPFSYELDFC